MSTVLPINTQRYESGDYTLEVTAHPSALSQWSDRTVVRQLRFSLWSEQPTRKRLATGDQLHLVALSDTVESYVQRHLTQQAWPQTHKLKLLDQDINLSTLQLFDLAEVLNAYGQRQIILPKAPVAKRRWRSRWWTSSAVASLLVAVGVTTAYLQYRPAAFNQTETAQVPKAVFEDEVGSAIAPNAAAPNAAPEASSAPAAEDLDALTAQGELPKSKTPREIDESLELRVRRDRGPAGNNHRLAAGQSPSRQQETESEAFNNEVAPAAPQPQSESLAADSEEASDEGSSSLSTADPFSVEHSELAGAPAVPESAPQPPAPTAPTSDITVLSEAPQESVTAPAELESLEADDTFADAAAADASGHGQRGAPARIGQLDNETHRETLDAIATQLAPYQPTGVTYPLVYHLQIAPDGKITAIEPISENAPAIAPSNQVVTPAPGRSLRVELIYTGTSRPLVNELFE
ncbi:DUF4335 domain-containing protein [Leptothoe spongobia]|uniref:DUF4335 domain-containing protein n=1 Tax=Leptothoe spongobia TAU-MAC 1115 TaxID=1967444 RepID=A0A947DGR8_9CYAN|nr:DUF4335 domain-containing protein [Leptothoe spongobia]MBT9316369.1 hypothetical protein [Leptothoe spongobia TAU-MAC 1115]